MDFLSMERVFGLGDCHLCIAKIHAIKLVFVFAECLIADIPENNVNGKTTWHPLFIAYHLKCPVGIPWDKFDKTVAN